MAANDLKHHQRIEGIMCIAGFRFSIYLNKNSRINSKLLNDVKTDTRHMELVM